MRQTDTRVFRRPPATPTWISDELLQHTIEVWQPFYARTLQAEDALEMILNVSQLLETLREQPHEEVRSPGTCK